MQKIKILFLILPLFLFSCQEKIVPVELITPDGDRVVVMEEYSGGSCVPCANAHSEIENLLGVYGENLIVITKHTFWHLIKFTQDMPKTVLGYFLAIPEFL